MKPMRALLIYLVFVFAGAAIVAPLVWEITHHVEFLSSAALIKRSPFHRYVSRCLTGLALIGLPWYYRRLGFHSWKELGISGFKTQFRLFLQGACIGLATLLGLGALLLLFGARDFGTLTAKDVITAVLSATLTGILVGCMEELLFRAALFQSLYRSSSYWPAVIVSSGVYALFHFFSKPAPPAEVHSWTGFLILGGMLKGFVNWRELLPAFLNLFCAGAILASGLAWKKQLGFGIGIHAGWIFTLKLNATITRPVEGHNEWIWGTSKLIDGWIALPILIGIWLFFERMRGKNETPAAYDVKVSRPPKNVA
ncbi:MAG: hypothetical protein JWN25_3395 [Verrucomicrobiales bacterium]|nr:hypothetical protein [Verrucomicrobiales bacterium]